MTSSIEIAKKDFPLASSFPSYRKRKVRIVKTLRVSIQDLNWSGGTRSEYHSVQLTGSGGGVATYHSWNMTAPWDNIREGSYVDLAPGKAMVRTGHFCGKESVLTMYVHPADAHRFGL